VLEFTWAGQIVVHDDDDDDDDDDYFIIIITIIIIIVILTEWMKLKYHEKSMQNFITFYFGGWPKRHS